jgi:hypothetical protein
MKAKFAASLALSATVLTLGSTMAAAAPGTSTDKAVSWGVAPANTAIGKDRAHFAYALAPGATLEDALAVVNHTDTPITLRTYASDAFSTSTGGLDLLPAATTSIDVGSWVKTRSATVTLAAGASAIVPFTVHVPTNATPGDHSGGLVTSLVTGAGTGAVSVDRRLGARIYLRVSGVLAPALQVGGLRVGHQATLNPVGSGRANLSYTVTNVGNVRLQAHQSVRISGPFGLFARTVTVADLPEILPGATLARTVTVPGVWPLVHLTARVELTPVGSTDQPVVSTPSATAASSFWALPWGQLVVLLIIAAACYAAMALRRRRRRIIDAVIADAVSQALERSA